ncbi:hypothetical protein B0H34DRAFT_47630 [Crassisporium funariophilum]|nr:hypothetical protein B0H34DRAFT_47630 [Crassisporium funariophilum]
MTSVSSSTTDISLSVSLSSSSTSSSMSSQDTTPPPVSSTTSDPPTPPPTSDPPTSEPPPPPTTSDPPPPPPTTTPPPPPTTTPPPPPPTTTPPPTPPTTTPPPPPPPTTSPPPPPSPEPSIPSTTFSSVVFLTTTDSRGSTTSIAPAVITSTSIFTKSDGNLVTVTQIIANPTLSPDNSSGRNSAFFRNTGAVAGVFILVGLAAASIILWIFFALRRRRRTQRLEHDSAVSATLAAAGFHRAPLDDEDDPAISSRRSRYGSPDGFLHQRRSSSGLAMSSIPSAGRASAAYGDNDAHEYNPYTDYIVPAGSREGYVSTPPPSAFIAGPYRDRSSTGGMGDNAPGHAPQRSSSSYEPLLTSYYRSSSATPPSPTHPPSNPNGPPNPPPRNPRRISDAARTNPPAYTSSTGHHSSSLGHQIPLEPLGAASAASSVYSSESTDHRLDPGLRQRLQDEADSIRDLRDEEDYSRPVLGIRNLPDVSNASLQ